ncbi:hypothetical protein CHS0354_001248 [Potamilus streckersoni]|uniref:Helicase ATP-binding domain-containing protein n=1 Tax=Potamilus streckersoni TaxID=2493646 RepID=A0AAE0VNE9_9BIVA|nr:hypothetical protein CHS0354_001248 [Potamilus streckersoni]
MQGGEASNPCRRRVEGRPNNFSNIKMKHAAPSLKFKKTEFAKRDSKSSARQNDSECPDLSQFCSERKSDDDEVRSLSELRSMVESHNDVNDFPSGDFGLFYTRKTKSSGDSLENSREIGEIHKNEPKRKLENKDSILHLQGVYKNSLIPATKNENVNDINGQNVTKSNKISTTDSKLKGAIDIKSKKTKSVSAGNENKRKQDYTNMSQKVKINPKSIKSKPSLLCVSFCDKAEVGSNVGEYIKYRLGDAFRYNIRVESIETVTEKGERNTKVTLSFPSKAAGTKARSLLRESNKKSTTKLFTYFPEARERELIVMILSETEFRFEQHLGIMLNQALQYLELHESKIKEKRAAFKKLEQRYKSGKLALKESERTKAENKATEDKCKELELQKKEFCSYIRSVHRQLEGIKYCVKFETKLNEIRTAFGIECMRLSNALPMYSRKSNILDTVTNSQVCVCVSLRETGSGKNTQIAQYLYQAGFGKNGIIGCTQPRKIAAVTLACHVASEMASSVGQVVGYHVGLKVKRTNVTKILYMTDQILLNECLKDEELRRFSCIIIDEAHERSVFTDLLLGMIKSALKRRPDLRLVITSATINPDVFVSYFGGPDRCPDLCVSGRTFPVEVIWLNPPDDQNPFEDYVNLAIKTAFDIHKQTPPAEGDI